MIGLRSRLLALLVAAIVSETRTLTVGISAPARTRTATPAPSPKSPPSRPWRRLQSAAAVTGIGRKYERTEEKCAAFPRHTISGLDIRAAGVVPYVVLPGNGIYFLFQVPANGTRAKMLCDFGGKRESTDWDVAATAGRELYEETSGLFGDADHLARRIRRRCKVTILASRGKYCTHFLRVGFKEPALLPAYDVADASDDAPPIARVCRWYRSDELLATDEPVVGRMLTNTDSTRWRGLTALQAAVCETVRLENAGRLESEQWHTDLLRDVQRRQQQSHRTWGSRRTGGKGAQPHRRSNRRSAHGAAGKQRRAIM